MQNSGTWNLWLPVVENSQLFAQRTARAQRTVRPITKDKMLPKLNNSNE